MAVSFFYDDEAQLQSKDSTTAEGAGVIHRYFIYGLGLLAMVDAQTEASIRVRFP